MKNLFNQTRLTGAALAFGLLSITTSGFANPSIVTDNKVAVEEEILEEFSFVEISEETLLVDQRPEKVMFFDGENELVYETEVKGGFEFQVEVLLRKSDLLMEFDGVKFYRLSN